MSNLKVNSKCIMCGSCLSLGCDFLVEKSDGRVEVRDNTFLKPDSTDLKSLIDICPVQAFEYDKNVKIESKTEQLAKIKEQLRNWKGINSVTVKDIPFKEEKYSMSMPYIVGSSYIYSSDRAAINAAETQFNNAAYSKINVFILQVISQYRADMVSPYYTYGPDTSSVYYKENQKIILLLKQAEKLSEKKLSSNFSDFDIYPSSDCCYKMLNKGELVGDNLVGRVRDEFDSGSYSSLRSYRMYYDWDDMEMYVGRGMFGKDKYDNKYCYRSLVEATRELEKDLRSALKYKTDDIQEHAVGIINVLVDVYNRKAKEEIIKKIDML